MPRGGGTPVPGTKTGITTTPVALAPSQYCRSLGIQADPDNLADLLVGDSGSQTMQLVAGASMSMEIDDPSKVWVAAVSGTLVANFTLII